MPNVLKSHFVLVPDRGGARRLRRAIADGGGAFGITVGTWPELVERLRVTHLMPSPAVTWEEAMRGALAAMADAPWHESLKVATKETTTAISRALREVIEAAFRPDGEGGSDALLAAAGKLDGRPALHLRALADLWQAIGTALPDDICIAIHALNNASDLRIEDLRVVVGTTGQRLTPLQSRLVDTLAPEADDARALDLHILCGRLESPACSSAGSALTHIANCLFADGKSESVALDNSIQVLAVRDAREEAEVAASMVQDLIRSKPDLSLADIGVLVPSDDAYSDAVRDAFTLAGLPLSGMSTGQRLRDFGREYVRHFLSCRQPLAPVMALAAFVTSPLAPWPEETGRIMASMVMRGDFRLERADGVRAAGKAILSQLRTEDESASGLAAALVTLGGSIRADASLDMPAAAAREAIALIQSRISVGSQVDLNELARLISPTTQSVDETAFWQDAVTIYSEGIRPWKQVRHLIVLGASSGRYPSGPFTSPVFNEHERLEIRQKIGLELPTAEHALVEGRQLFLAQLRAVQESLTVFVPERDADGKPLAPSESLVFVARLLGCDLDALILRLNMPNDRAKARFVPAAERPATVAPLESQATAFEMGVDLLALRKDKDGKSRPQSPSRLETLLVSPLAFVLQELDAVPDEWTPELADPALRGTLAHAVFEQLFTSDQPVPDAKTIRERSPVLLEEYVRRSAPFFMSAAWSVERQTLTREIETAAVAWGEFLRTEKARIIGNEFTLMGSLDGVDIHGRADALVGLGNGRFLIVDYKKSSSRRRQLSMQAGFDIQLPLYRMMATNGSTKGLAEEAATTIRSQAVGIAYFMMDDGRALADAVVNLGISYPSWRPIETDISAVALPAVRKGLAALRGGSIERDTISWHTQLEKAGNLRLYALDISPLVARYVLDDSLQSGGGGDAEA